MFQKVLIANRGEIACRIANTCRRLNIRTVAVFSEADAGGRHVAMCDEAWLLGPPPARASYLRVDKILEIARLSGADALHPGYGFLSENADFARACDEAGLIFIGPPPAAIDAMGSKSTAKSIMGEAGVPVVPGYHGEKQDLQCLAEHAAEIGYPVLIKPSAGGGGKGMHRIDQPEDLAAGLLAAKRESAAAFGDDRVLIEKFLLEPRHIEIQVFADSHGNVVHLFERDCSIQRRHQKVVEEAPAPRLTPERRDAMGIAATRAAKAIGYVGAGTVEFIADQAGEFFFMEMNTRLQVEHPVTEMITGQDLVEWQLRIAGGEPLPCGQQELKISGHALEVRIYAEDPDSDFLPATGRIHHLRTPLPSRYVRIDTGVREGDTVSVHYDPMIAKLIVWGEDRDEALRRMRIAINDVQVVGPSTNVEFLKGIVTHPAFRSGDFDTGFVDRYREHLCPVREPVSDRVVALASLHGLLRLGEAAAKAAACSNDPYSPWCATDGWRLHDNSHHCFFFIDDSHVVTVIARFLPGGGYLLELPTSECLASGEIDTNGSIRADLNGVRLTAFVVRVGADVTVFCDGRRHRLSLHDPLSAAMATDVIGGNLKAPMTGTVVDVLVAQGQSVKAGDPLIVLEAMKMEYTVCAVVDGVIETVHFVTGEQVTEESELLTVTQD